MNFTKKVLIADDMHASIIPMFQSIGYAPTYRPHILRSEILEEIKHYDGFVLRSKTTVDQELIDQAVGLQYVVRAGAGMDNIDVDYLESKRIFAINAPEGNRDALAEHTIGMLLTLLHRISYAHNEIARMEWNRASNRGVELKGKVVGIYGVGFMGTAVAQKLSGFGCHVIGYDKYKKNFGNAYVREVNLKEFMEKTEILSIHIPLQTDTRYLFDQAYLEKFYNLMIIINTSRGEILKLKALLELLRSDKLYGAALDVIENEKLHTYTHDEKDLLQQLIAYPNIIITPHVGGWTHESYQRINEVIIEKVKEFIAISI